MGVYGGELGWGGWILLTLAIVVFWALVMFGLVRLFRARPRRQRERIEKSSFLHARPRGFD